MCVNCNLKCMANVSCQLQCTMHYTYVLNLIKETTSLSYVLCIMYYYRLSPSLQ